VNIPERCVHSNNGHVAGVQYARFISACSLEQDPFVSDPREPLTHIDSRLTKLDLDFNDQAMGDRWFVETVL